VVNNDIDVGSNTCLAKSKHKRGDEKFNNLFNGTILLHGPFHEKQPNTAYIPTNLSKEIKTCSSKRMMIIRLSFWGCNPEKPKEGHANVIVIDNQEKTVERFEPNGYSDKHDSLANNFMAKHFVPKYFNGYKYLPPLSFMPKIGPQRKQTETVDNDFGFCAIFSTMYAHLRLVNPDIPQKNIVQKMSEGTGEQVDKRIKLYYQNMHNKL